MIASETVAEVRRLLGEGKHSQREIARLMGISRGSISAIASGRRPDYESLGQAEQEEWQPDGPPARCPGCGGMVYLPCLLCRVREAVVGSPQRTPQQEAFGDDDPLALKLRPEHRARFEEMRAWPREVADPPQER
jgi:transcriptional regulator with XRE-family HTH domain